MEPLWSPGVATGGNRRQIDRRLKPQKQARSVATGCHRLRATFHGKEHVCHRLPPVAEDPLLVREGVDFLASQRIESRELEGGQDSARRLSTATLRRRRETPGLKF